LATNEIKLIFTERMAITRGRCAGLGLSGPITILGRAFGGRGRGSSQIIALPG